MNKNIIAGAILAALSTAAAAQSSVTVYGIVDAGINYEGSAIDGRLAADASKKGNRVGLSSGNMAGSRLGFRGVEDLGNGLNAIFTLEAGYDVTTGAHTQNNLLMGRQAFVGLQGNFGTVKMGRQYTAYDTILGGADTSNGLLSLRSMNLIGNSANSQPGVAGQAQGFIGEDYTVRKDNLLTYETPDFAGLTAQVGYGFGEVQGDNAAGRLISVMVQYKNQGLWIGAGHQQEHKGASTAPVTALAKGKRTDSVIGASYDFGVAKINALYSKAVRKQDAVGGAPAAADRKEDAYQVGVSAPFGAHKVMFSYTHLKNQNEGQKGNASQFGLGYTFDLSKRTTVYASLAKISNKDEAKYTVGNTMNGGIGETGATVGVRHAF